MTGRMLKLAAVAVGCIALYGAAVIAAEEHFPRPSTAVIKVSATTGISTVEVCEPGEILVFDKKTNGPSCVVDGSLAPKRLYMIIVLDNVVAGTAGPLPYGVAECQQRAATYMATARVKAKERDYKDDEGKRLPDFEMRCEFHLNPPETNSNVAVPAKSMRE